MKLPTSISRFSHALGRIIFDTRSFLCLVALAYTLTYLNYPATPGNDAQFPLGWWGWFDQGKYLDAARAFTVFDFLPGRHFYPPLYSLLGALFLGAGATHPFWLINLVCLLWFAFVFVSVARRCVPQWLATVIFLLTIVGDRTLFINFIIPWTSTLSTAMLSVGIYVLSLSTAGARTDNDVSPWPITKLIATGSLALGLIAALRPPEAIVGGVLWLGVLASTWVSSLRDGRKFMKLLAIALLAMAAGPLLFFSFNQWVFGSPLGGYIQAGEGNGYFLADSAEKFVSLFLDGYTLYLEPKSGLLDHYPWLAVALPALAFVIIRGDMALRVIAVAVCAQFALYLPYGDLLPTGLWRYQNIHYFKWTFPYLALVTCYATVAILRELRANSARGFAWLTTFALAALLMSSLRTEVSLQPLSAQLAANSRCASTDAAAEIVIQMGSSEIDLIDIRGLSGGFSEVYFGDYVVTLDGHHLTRAKDYRVLPAPWGVRILFSRPVRGERVVLSPDGRLTMTNESLGISSGSYRFVLGRPKPFWNEVDAIPKTGYVMRNLDRGEMTSGKNGQEPPAPWEANVPPAPPVTGDAHPPPAYRLGTSVDFSSAGTGGDYTLDGWSTPEAWGRWSIGNAADLSFKLQPRTRLATVELCLGAYITNRNPEQRIDIEANGRPVKRLLFNLAADGGHPRRERFTVALGTDAELRLTLRTPDAASPVRLGLSADNRTLGVALINGTIISTNPDLIGSDAGTSAAVVGFR